jgi:hypothetical protein
MPPGQPRDEAVAEKRATLAREVIEQRPRGQSDAERELAGPAGPALVIFVRSAFLGTHAAEASLPGFARCFCTGGR